MSWTALLFIDTVERLLVGEAVNDRSGEDIEVAVEEVEFIFLTAEEEAPPLRLVGMPDNRLMEGGVNSAPLLSETSNVLLADNLWPILAKDSGSLEGILIFEK